MRRVAVMLLLLGITMAPVARAEVPYERLFAPGGLDGLAAGATLRYTLTEPPAPDGPAPGATGTGAAELTLSLGGAQGAADTAILALVRGGTEQRVGSFPASVGNPLIMYFLESVLRDMASRAGGSPFYIRNRIREALLRDAVSTPLTLSYGGQAITGERISFSPFTDDAARARMGGFGALELAFVVAPRLPGRFLSLSASASAAPAGSPAFGYSRSLALLPGAGR